MNNRKPENKGRRNRIHMWVPQHIINQNGKPSSSGFNGRITLLFPPGGANGEPQTIQNNNVMN